ncbi:MAG: prolyl oligopeptidase family serine peptidase [candidate division Zixibacteria bacterium]|nr:prolyl oligopeptidase family serine peptidase [candidate division Zixibacteria bacterium]
MPIPPKARIQPDTTVMFGHRLIDNYSWLHDRDDPEVLDYLKAENEYTESMTKHTAPLQEKLYQEILSHIKETDLSVPVRWGEYYYYSRTEKGKQYRIYCRKFENLNSAEEILLDVNQLAEGKNFMQVGIFQISPDHKLLAYAYDDKGNERYTINVKNLQTGEILPDKIENAGGSLVWANDNRTFFYTVPDDAWRFYKVYRHTLGQPVSGDALIFHEQDEAFNIYLGKSKSGKYLFLYTGGKVTSEEYFLKADNPFGRFSLIQPRRKDIKYWSEHHDDHFYIVTNDGAKNYKLVKAPISNPSAGNWKDVIAGTDSVKIENIEVFRDFLVIEARKEGSPQIMVRNFQTAEVHYIEFPEETYSIWPSYWYRQPPNPDYESEYFRFTYRSFVTPNSVYDYNMRNRERVLLKQKEVPGDYNPELYQSEKTFAITDDGVEIPISMVYKKGMVKDGSNPLHLYGYGSYGSCEDPWFSSARLSLLDRGFISAIAHVRGGGEMGEYWYEDGKLLKKTNSFKDFITVAEYVIKENYTSPDRLLASGASAGGLLVGASANMRPDLFKAVVASVPFVDLINTMLDSSMPLTVTEYDEWGNPNQKEFFEYMLSYSPYDNIRKQDYPDMLIMASLNDTRVMYWEAAKWTAKLRAHTTGKNLLLLKTNMGAGHGGYSGRYDYLKEIAFEYAFMLDMVGIYK